MQAARPTLPGFQWPAGFERLPGEAWTTAAVDPFALAYDALKGQSWYANLDRTVRTVAPWLEDDALVVDYSGGTGILAERLLLARPEAAAGLLNVDASAKFLRLAIAKLASDPRCGFRLLPYLKDQGRLRRFDEVAAPLVGRIDGIACANAIHLYPDPAGTARTWHQALRPGGRLHVQSGNIKHGADGDGLGGSGPWIIDRTVEAVDAEARRIVMRDPAYARHRASLSNRVRMDAYEGIRRRYFTPVRSLEQTVDAIAGAGFAVDGVHHQPVAVETADWGRFLGVYHEGVLPWVGGCRQVDGRDADAASVEDRLRLIALALPVAVGGSRFKASWTYVDARKA